MLAAALEPARDAHGLRGVRVDRRGRGRPRRRRRRARGSSPRRRRRGRRRPPRAASSHSGSPRTTTAPGATTASFSAAIASRVSPSTSVWSSATFVSTTTAPPSTFVASWRPPRPASTTATSTPARGELGERGGRQHLELRRARRVRPYARERALEVGVGAVDLDPLGPAAHVRRDVRADAQALRPAAARRSCSVVDVLPFVPTTWIAGKRALRLAERRRAGGASARARTPPATARARQPVEAGLRQPSSRTPCPA